MNNLEKLQKIVSEKVARDIKGTWSKGSSTYLEAMYAELKEVEDEIEAGRQCHLEDELGDVLWVYLCMLEHLELEERISMERVFQRSEKKYSERVKAITSGGSWESVKTIQKKALDNEQKSTNNRSHEKLS
ncbi:MazG nucleotide pyrophosphohydrolase domain-containing protein [Vibrio splendidus]|uniref:MazG nucleotide pyrophosphohydrolase domain-containing protein n=1 Tax=Vibrio splendidus TaxID=29497 RepID=UPI000C82360B|nr:MazG nucleotide pyrophosphohydrolase domain-containing protein [Vibrio splendidus]PMH09504.1 hypothetical protein BCU75_14355 [Vibrio splendidus]